MFLALSCASNQLEEEAEEQEISSKHQPMVARALQSHHLETTAGAAKRFRSKQLVVSEDDRQHRQQCCHRAQPWPSDVLPYLTNFLQPPDIEIDQVSEQWVTVNFARLFVALTDG